MDAREQLRRYLDQRKEAGESELVLDQLDVDDVMRLIGARTATKARDAVASPKASVEPGADWRDVLRQHGAEPDAKPATPDADIPAAPATAPAAIPPSPAGLTVGGSAGELFGAMTHLATLDDVAGAVASCKRCPLYSTALNPVPGTGNASAGLMIVGEAPGATEDEQGLPFVGAAGQLLTKILAAVDLKREDVFICNVLKHRPPGNRNPMPDEVTACSPYLFRQFELIRPRAILALGTFAAQTLLQTKLAIGKLRGQVHRFHGVPLIVTYHPAALLRNPSWKRPTWEDVQLVRRILDSAGPVAQS